MNKDIRLATAFRGHRKRKKLKRLLGFGAEVYLIDLWLTVAMDCPEGVLVGWKEEDIADACNWERDPRELVSAMIESHWLEKDSDGEYAIHDWCEHQGWACKAKLRSDAAKKAAEVRWQKRSKASEDRVNGKDNATALPSRCESDAGALHEDANRNAPSPNPSPTPTPMVNDNTDSSESASCSQKREYRAKSGKKLTGKRLETFERFWDTFDLKQGKASAAEAWLKIPHLTDHIVKQIISAAEMEASRRPALIEGGGSPKWAQGWLSERRWEDELYQTPSQTAVAEPAKSDEQQIEAFYE